jgi:hypothetical protein
MSILKRELAEEETSHMTSIIEPFDEAKPAQGLQLVLFSHSPGIDRPGSRGVGTRFTPTDAEWYNTS